MIASHVPVKIKLITSACHICCSCYKSLILQTSLVNVDDVQVIVKAVYGV